MLDSQPRRVLIVDGSPEEREQYRQYLLGDPESVYILQEASTGQEGLAYWQWQPADVVILGDGLPDLQGLEFLARLHVLSRQPVLPVVLLVDQGQEATARQARQLGVQTYRLRQQLTPEGLQMAVEDAIAITQTHTQIQHHQTLERLTAFTLEQLYQSLDLETFCQMAASQLRQFLHTDRVLIVQLQPDGWGLVMTESVGDGWDALVSTSYYDPCFARSSVQLLRQGVVLHKTNIHDGSLDACHSQLLESLQVRASLVTPILHRGEVWGMIIAHHCTSPRRWQALEVEALRLLATQISIALQRLDLHQKYQRSIAKHHQTEAKLWESQDQLQRQLAEIEAIYQTAPIGLNVLDTDLRFVRINRRLAEINGLPEEAHLGRTVRELLPDLAEAAETVLKRILETGEPLLNVEIRGETPAQPGVKRVWLEHFLPLKQGDQVIGISTVCEEITERIQAAAALRESEARFRNMADNAPVMIWVTDAVGQCTYLSQSWYDFTGQTEATGLGMGWLGALHPEDYTLAQQAFLQAIERQQGFRLEYRLRHRDGEYRWAIDAATPWLGEEGQVQGFIGSVIDISDRKRIEAERELLLEREQAAREAAERANRIKDEFLAVLSHELRTPLNPILGWATLLQTRKLDADKTAQALAAIERNAKLQIQLVDDLLDTAKILRGKLSLQVTVVNLAAVIDAAMDTVRPAAEAKSIAIRPTLAPINPVAGDATRLQQIVWNLLSNAIKFTPGGGQVIVRLEEIDRQAQITVQDTGRGISPDFLPYLFQSFRQEDFSTTRQHGGLGLGLAIVRQLVEAHGGTISATSSGEGQGATFTVRLPLPPESSQLQPAPQLPGHPPDLSHLRVLMVDDDPDTRALVEVILGQYGADVMAVASGAEALSSLATFQPDVLISDIGMPEMDGYALIQQIRALPAAAGGQVPAIALTAYAREADQQRALSSGYQHHLTKPLEVGKLAQALMALLSSGGNSSS